MPEYYNVTTNLGDAEIANAIATNTKLNITHIAFGDGNGSVPTPNKARTSLVREVHRQAVTKYERHATNANWIVIETIIPSDIGGFTIREMGIIANGKLISHGSHAPFEKLADPSGVSEYRLKFTQNITDGNVVSLILDESLIYATQAWVNENYVPRADIVNNLTTADATKTLSAEQGRELEQKKVDKTAIRKTFGNTYAPVVGAGYDFNNILPGDYVFKDPSITTLNAPPFEYASVYCEGTLTNEDQRFVIAREYFSGKLAVRARQNGNWSGWSVVAFNSDNVASATKLQTARTISISGAVTGTETGFDGSANIAIETTEIDGSKINTGTIPAARIPAASTSAAGAVKLNNTLTSTSTTEALTAAQGKVLNDRFINDFLNLKTENGYQKLPNGLIIQWGQQNESTTGTFPISFPTNALSICATLKAEAAPWDGSVTSSYIVSNSQFKVGCGQLNGNILYWIAIGY